MEKIFNNPGLQHLAEKVFLNLEWKDLEVCAMINQLSKQILENPIFWLKKFVSRGMSKKNETEWAKAIKSAKKYNKKKQILSYMKWHLMTPQEKADFPFCPISNSVVQKKFRKHIYEAVKEENTEIVRMLAPLAKSNKASKNYEHDSINLAIYKGHTEIIKILAPLTDNPNSPYHGPCNFVKTPIYWAARNGHTKIVEFLAPLTKNPNASDDDGKTPI